MRGLLVGLIVVLAAACASPQRQVPDAGMLSADEIEAYRSAADALDAGDPAAALGAIELNAGREPWHVPSHVVRQDALAALGRETEAVAWYAGELARVPLDPARSLLAARLAPRERGTRETAYREALAMDPASVWARIALAYELARRSREEAARATERADGGFEAESVEATRRSHVAAGEAESVAAQAVAARPDLAAAHGALGDVLLAAPGVRGERAVRALQASERAATLDPGSASTWERLGRARRLLSDDEGAVNAYLRALAIAPRDAALHASAGRVLLDLRRDDEARAALLAAARLDPADRETSLNLGTALFRTGELQAARAEFRRAAELAPTDPRAHEGLALTLAELGDREGAASAMERYLASGGPDRDAARRFVAEMRGEAAP